MNRPIALAALALALLAGRSAQAQENPVIGTFDVNGGHDKKIVVRRSAWDGVSVEGKLADGSEVSVTGSYWAQKPIGSGGAAYVGSGSWVFDAGASGGSSEGVSQVLGGIFGGGSSGTPSPDQLDRYELRPVKGGNAELAKFHGSQLVTKMSLVREKAALIIHDAANGDNNEKAFGVFAAQVAKYYRSKGYPIVETGFGDSWGDIAAIVSSAEAQGHPYSRLVMIGHSGWDGPLIWNDKAYAEGGSQASEKLNPELFHSFCAAVKLGTTDDCKIFISGCHSGGSDVYEAADELTYNADMAKTHWVGDLFKETGRFAAGPMGSTSTEWSLQNVKAVLEGDGNVSQAIYLGASGKIIPGKGTLAQAK